MGEFHNDQLFQLITLSTLKHWPKEQPPRETDAAEIYAVYGIMEFPNIVKVTLTAMTLDFMHLELI